MANREYFYISTSHGIEVDISIQTSEEVKVKTWLGKSKIVTKTSTRHVTSLPLYVYHEVDKNKWYEFFTGEKMLSSGSTYGHETIRFESAQDVGIVINTGFYGNAGRMTAEHFANQVKPLMPYKAQIVNAIRRWIQKEQEIERPKRLAREAAEKSERDAESWLDSVLKNR